MVIFVQPFGLQSPAGGPRILRALLRDAPQPFLSVCTSPAPPPPTTLGPERHVPLRPHFGWVERTRLGRPLGHLLPAYTGRFRRRLTQLCRANGAMAIHAIPHGIDFWEAFQVAGSLGLRYILNVHDEMDYNLRGRPELKPATRRLAEVWERAQARLVISEAMGREYCRRYGDREYDVVTDGLTEIPVEPRVRPPTSWRIYFAGAIHLSYEANFRSLIGALEILQDRHPEYRISLICRGSSWTAVGSRIPITALPLAPEAEVARDLDSADFLYLPLPFDVKFASFSRFSLSTKMVTYLGSGLPILYHGPAEAAAGAMLAQHQAAIPVNSLEPQRIAEALASIPPPGVDRSTSRTVSNALELARRQFRLADQRERFWQTLAPLATLRAGCGVGDECLSSAPVDGAQRP